MLEREALIPAPDQSIYQPAPPTPTNVPNVLGMFGQQDAVLPPDTDQLADFYAAGHTPSSAQANMQPERFNWKSSGADRYVNADRYLQEGFDPFAGSVQVGDKSFDFNEERYDKLQTWGDALKKGGGQFLALTSSTFVDSLKGEAMLANALFNFGTGYIDNFKERLIGTPEELALRDEQHKAIFDKYAIFHGSSAETSVINKQFVGDLIGQSGFAIGPIAEFLLFSLVTAGIGSGFSMVTKGAKLVTGSKVANLMVESSKIAKIADQMNDGRKVTDITKNAKLMDQIMGSLKQGAKWSAKQLNPIAGTEDIYKAVQAGATPVQLGITTVGALKNSLSQANMAFNEARFEAAGTFGQIYGDLLTKFEKDNGRSPNAQELEKIEQLAYGGATDNFIVNSGILMTMNSLQFGALFSKFSSTSKFLREAMETGAEGFTVSGKIEGKAAKRTYESGKFGAFGKFNTIRKDFGVGTALYTVGKKAATGTAARFEISEGLQEILQTGSGDALKDYYVNMYDGSTDMDGNHIFDADYMSAIKAQYNKEGWRTFLMGAMTGYLISPLQASVMYTAKKGYGRINDNYRKETNAYEKAVADAIDLQNSFYKNPATALNDAIKNFKVVSKAGESMTEAIQEGDKYTYHNAKDDALASTVAAALKTNTLPSLLDSIQEMSNWSDQEIVEAFPTILTPGEDMGSVKEYINSIATDIKQYNKNWDKLKEDYGHLVMPELYKANQAEYTQALYAKRALDEAIELLATTDYKATKAIQRAVDIKNKMSAIPGLGTSISHGFNILSSRQQTAIEISNLTQMIAAAEGLPLDEESSKLTNSHKEQLAALVAWDALYNKWETAKDSLSDEEFNKLTDSYEAFIEAHNKQGGVSNNVINKTALREAFPNLGQYIALNRDAEKYTEALNVLANPRDFTRLYSKIVTDIQRAAAELNKKANKEAEETIKEEFVPTPEATETQTPEEIDIQLFAERIDRGEDISSPEDVQFYDNNKEAIEDILVTIQDGGIEARITRIATEMLNTPTPQQKDQKFVTQYSKRIAAKLKELKAAGTTVTEEETVTEEPPTPEEQPETVVEQPIGDTKMLSKISKVYDYSFIVPKDRAAFDKIVGALTPEQLKEGTSVVIKRNVPVGTADSKPTNLKLTNLKLTNLKLTGLEANPHIQVRQLQGTNRIYIEEYTIEVQYNGQTLGFMSDPYINTFVFNGQVVPVSQLSEEQFKAIFKLQSDRNVTTTLVQFQQSYANGVAVRNAIIAMANPDGTPTTISSDRLPIEFDISTGELDYIPEKEADRRDTLKAEMQNRGIELPTDENPTVRVGVIDTLDKKDILTRGTELVEYTKDYNEQLGRYIAVFVGKGGNKTTRALKSPIVQDAELTERITNSNNNRSKIVEAVSANTVLSPTEIKRANELSNLFITTSPNTGIYFYIGIDKMGKYTITGVSGSKDNKKTAVHSFDTAMPTDAEEFRAFLTEEARKLGAKLGVNLDAVTITRNNVREGIKPDATVEEILNMQVVAGTKNRIVTYKPAVAQNTIQQGFPNVPEKASTSAPIEGGSKVAVDLGTVQLSSVKKENDIISFETGKGSIYKYGKDGKTTRFKTVENKEYPTQDLTVFIKFENIQQEQDYLEAAHRKNNTKLYIIDLNGQIVSKNEQVKEGEIRLAIVKNNKVIESIAAKNKPEVGYNVFDQRRFLKEGEEYREVHIGNKVVKINYSDISIQPAVVEETVIDTPAAEGNTPKKAVNKLKDKAAKKSKGLDNTTGKALKVISESQAPQYIENIAKFKQWVQDNLPDTISVEEVDSLAADLVTNNITAGEFLTYILDSGKIGGKIRTTKDGQFKYHEAFHAVFRLLLPQQQIDRLLYLAAQESPVTADKLEAMRKLHSDYRAMDNAELTERYYEEYLADKFDSWKNNRAVKTHHGIKAFFAKLWDIIQKIAARITRNDIKKLFYQIDEGSFRYTQVQPNQFTEDTAFIDSTASVKKVILVGTKEIQTPEGVIEVNKYLPQEEGDILATSIAAMFFKSIQTEGQYNTNQLLDQIIGMYAELYNFEGPDGELKENYEVLLENADPVTREYLEDKLSDYYNLFTHPKAIRSLKEAVMVHLKINGIKQTLEDDEYETIEEEVGERNTENFDRDAGTIGGYKSLAKGLRMYIAGTTIPFKDTFGNEWLVAPKEGVPGIPLEQAVNANFVYNGMLKALSNSSDIRILMSRLYTYYNNSGNQATTAFIQRVMNDTGLQIQPNGEFTVDNTKNSILLQQVIKAFNQYEEDHLHITIQKDDVGNWLYTTSVANKTKATENQLNQWSAAYDRLFVVGAKQLQSKEDKDRAITTINTALAKIEQQIDTPELRSKEINQSVLTRVSREVSNVLKTTLGINLHPSFIAYSILVNKAPEARTEDQQLFVEAFNTDSASNNTNAYITPESIAAIRKAIKGEGSIFSDQAMREVLKGLATGNSYFDETINTISYTNADNKVVYSHKLPSFYNRSIYDLNKKAVLAKYRRDASRTGSYLLNDEEFKYLSDKKMLRSDSTDGIRVVDGDAGLTYGKFGDRERLAYLFGFYTGAKKIKRKEGDFYVSPHMVRIVEAKNSAPIVYLPVIPSVMLGQLTTNALDKMTLGIQAEVDRIKEFKKELKAIKAGKMKPIEGYHTGKRYDKEGPWELPTPNENVSNWKTKPRGFFLFDGAQMVGPLKAELEAGNLDIEKLHDQLNEYWIAETKRTIDMMVDLGFIKYDAGTGKYTNRLAPEYLFIGMPTQGGRAEALNINPNDFFHNVMQVVVDDYINTKAINTLLMGNEAAAFKDGVDQIKRASGAAAAYIPMNVDVINPDWDIDAPLVYTQHVTYKSNNFKKMSDAPGKATGDKDDAQMYMTEKGLRYLLFGLGKLNQTQVDVLRKLANGESLTAEEFYGAGGLKEKGAFNSYKLVHFDGQVYLKCSTLPLFRNWVSILDSNGDWIANPETEELHELLNKMEEQETLMEADGKNIVVFAHPTTASKAVKRGVVDNISAITSESFEELPAAYTGLQLENPSNKTTITDPTQAKQQIMAEQDDNSDVIFMGKTMKAGDVKRLYMTSTAQRKANNYNSAVNDIFSFEDGMIELGKAIEVGKVTPKLGNFYKRAIETLVASGTDSHTLGFFQLDENGEPIYNNNFPAILPKFTELFLSYFSKGILSEKVPGTSVALVSPFGAKKFKQVTSIWQPTDKGYLPEYEGQPKTWKVITTNEVLKDPEYYRRIAKRWTGDPMERRFFDVQPGDIILDDLRHNYPKYNEKGEYLGRFSEFVMPAHYKEVMNSIPESLRYNFGIRIPSDDKHSYIALEYVDVLPVQYGSIGIFPQELIEISGADFDIDKLYMEFMDTYVSNGRRVAYGTAVSLEDQFEEYLTWQKENNKVVKAKFEEVAETKEGLIATLLGDDRRILTATLQELGMPYDLETFKVKGTRNNNGVLTNEILGAKLAMLNNDKIAEDTPDKRAIINQPTSVDMLASMVTDLRNKFTEILNNEDIIEEDKRGIQTILGVLSDPVADINTIRGKILASGANKEGSRNIGAAVNSMLTFSVLGQGDVYLTTPITFSGQDFTGFGGDTTIDGVRKFAQISSIVNAMTDNAKERLAAKLGLNIEAVGYVSAMIAIGIPMESGVLLMLQPVVREYFKKLQNLKGSLKTSEEAKTSRASVLKVMLEEYKIKTADALGVSKDKVEKVELTNDILTKNIADNGRFVENQYSALLFMSQIADISSRMIEVANVTKLSKGLPTEFSLVDSIIESIQNLQEDPSKPPAVFEPMDALEDNDIIATDMAILKQLNQLAPVIFTERTTKFKAIQQSVKSLFTPLIGVSGQEFNEQIKNDILSYLTIAAFMHSGTPGDKGTLVNSLIYNNDENNIIGLVEKGRAMIAKSTVGKNYMLNNYIATVPTNGKGKTNEIRINSWTNVSEQVQEKIAASFVDLYTNAYTDAETGEELDTRPIAAAMFNYLLVKDGGQFKSGSFVKYIANFIFSPLLDSAGELNVAIKNEEELEKLTGKSSKELTSSILQSIGTHINSEKRIPKIPTKGDGLPDGMLWSDDLSTITYTVPQNIIDEGRSYHAGFEINAKEVYAVFPLYLRSPDSKLFQLTRTVDNKGQQEFQFLENGQPMGIGISAEYKRINYTGAINTWAGGGVFGPVPVAPSQSNQVVTNNPGYETSANPINNTTIASGATVLPSITPEDTTAVTWKEAIASQNIKVTNIVGGEYVITSLKDGTILGKLSDTPDGQGGFFTTPEQFGEAIIKRRGWTQKTDDGEVTLSEEPVVPLQNMKQADLFAQPQTAVDTTIQKPFPGVENIPDTGLSVSQANEFIDLLQPQILNQSYIENKARTANRMFSFGLRWAKKIPNNTERSKQRVAGSRTNKVAIKGPIPEDRDPYGYYKTDQNNNPLPTLDSLEPIIEFIENKLGIDMSNYDSVLANIYESGSFIHQHRDTTESESAKKYPVIVLNLGADGNLIYHTEFSDETKYNVATNTYNKFEVDVTKHSQLPIKNGGIYAFGVEGINRFTFNHRVSENTQNTVTKPITVPVWDTEGNKTGEQQLKNYRITLTFRRAQDITGNVPKEPKRIGSSQTMKPEVPLQSMEPTQQPTNIPANVQAVVDKIVTPEMKEAARGTKVWTEYTMGNNIRGEIIGDIKYAGDNGFAPKVAITIMEDNGKVWKRNVSSSDMDSWKHEATFNRIYNEIQTNWEKYKNELEEAIRNIPQQLSPEQANISVPIQFKEHPLADYPSRTRENASADVTIALAVDFNTAGEKLTKNSVTQQGKMYIPIDLNKGLEVTAERVNKIVDMLNRIGKPEITMNIAGNGIYTMVGQYTQPQLDEFMYQLLSAVLQSPNLKTKIVAGRTGGQTGMDEAGAKAMSRLGIPTTVLAPKGWKMRGIDGKDVSGATEFQKRFLPAGSTLSPEQWKAELTAIYKEKNSSKGEREWLQEALAFRNSLRGKINDNDIINKIKDCL